MARPVRTLIGSRTVYVHHPEPFDMSHPDPLARRCRVCTRCFDNWDLCAPPNSPVRALRLYGCDHFRVDHDKLVLDPELYLLWHAGGFISDPDDTENTP